MKGQKYIEIMGGSQMNPHTFEGRRFLIKIIRMEFESIHPSQFAVSWKIGFLAIQDWEAMLDYIDEFQN